MPSIAVDPFLVRARLVKTATDDGSMSLKDSLKVGDYFIIDISTKSPVPMQATDNRIVIQSVVQCAEDGKWLPMECLELLP
jgi:hypothetical protein